MTDARQTLPPAEEIAAYLKSFDFFDRYVGNRWEGDYYADAHARRFRATLDFLPDLPASARALELGAVPYYMTCLLARHRRLLPETLSFYEVEQETETRHVVESRKYGERYEFGYRAVNVERDVFPFADESFDLVLCCEILEHLLINPTNMLYESHRVLRPGGLLLLTTPNVLRWGNVLALLRGRNVYDHYRGNGVYGRHQREYTPAEVAVLLEANGFEVERLETVHVYGRELLNRVPLLFDQRRDNIFALARRRGRPRMGFPEMLYLLMDEYRSPARPSIEMGANEVGQIGRGWHEFEQGAVGFRWTKREAEFYLKNEGAASLVLRLCCQHPDLDGEPVTLSLRVNGEEAGSFELKERDWQELSFPLGAARGQAVLRCELQVSRAWVPSLHTGSADARELGVAVQSARLE